MSVQIKALVGVTAEEKQKEVFVHNSPCGPLEVSIVLTAGQVLAEARWALCD